MSRRRVSDRRAMDEPPPHDMTAEYAVLGAVLVNPPCLRTAGALAPGDFYRKVHQDIWRVMLMLDTRGVAIDLVTLAHALREEQLLDEVGGPAYLTGLTDGVPRSSNIGYYAKIVRDYARRRDIMAAATAIAARGLSGEATIEAFADWATAEILRVANTVPRAGFVKFGTLLPAAIASIEKPEPGLSTGFGCLDELLGGLHRGDLIYIAARPSVGKTALLMDIAAHAATAHKAVGLFSLEMANRALTLRMLANRAEVSGYRLQRGWVTSSAEEMARLSNAWSAMDAWPLFLDDSPLLAVEEVSARSRALKAEYPDLALLGVDYIQLMRSHAEHDSRQQELSTISRSLKGLARELDVPVVVLSQLNRESESRRSAKPRLSDLRESGALEQDADVVLLLWRPHEEREKNAEIYTVEIVIGKQRNGPANVDTALDYVKAQTRFVEQAAPAERPGMED